MNARKIGHPSLNDSVLQAVLDAWGRVHEEHWLPIVGRSMWPLIREGDVVLVVHGDTDMRRGDVALCRRGGRLVAHRVLRIDGSERGTVVITKGDHTGQCDAPWNAQDIVGRVAAVKRGDRYLSLNTAGGRAIGRLIARVTLAWIRLDRSSRDLKYRLLGPQPNRFTAVLRRSARALSALVLHGIHAVFWRTFSGPIR